MTKTRILIADDHQVVRKGVAALLGERPDWEICAEASTGKEAVAAAARLKPDVVVMDICMPDMNGLEATRHILHDNPQTQVLILSMHESDQLVREV
ncbi:MAG TPA: response regulator transcription factor, partial [Bryobacteraceae bacterium]|nr:response regulator transcription factor [Bryobacteraceae bacterium]